MTEKKMNLKRNSRLLTVIVLSVAMVFIIHACQNGKKKKAETALTKVTTMIVQPTSVKQTVTISGKIEAADSTSLAFKIGGRIDSIKYDVGDFIRKSKPMASLEQDEITARATQAKLAHNKMKRDYERVKQLYDEKAATREQLQDITTGLQNTEQQLKVAEYNLRHSKIYAPFDGYVAMRRHEPEEMINPGDPVFIFVGNTSDLKIKSGIAGSLVAKLKTGATVEINASSLADAKFSGRVKRVGVVADMATGTFPIEISVNNKQDMLKPGMVVAARIEYGNGSDQLLVPPDALIEADEDRGYLFLFDAKEAAVRKTAVKLGSIIANKVVIISGLKPGDEIILEGAQYLVSGQKVEKLEENGKGDLK
jgi:RND family efflux transporter MFP subunit